MVTPAVREWLLDFLLGLAVIAGAIWLASCAVPVAPTAAPQVLCVSGQSNATGLLQALGARAQGWAEGAQPIRFWHADARGWASLVPFLTPACAAFVWFQGETDDIGGETPELGQFGPTAPGVYRLELAALLGRVRLPAFVVQIAPRFVATRGEQAAGCAAVAGCRMVGTDDLAFPDGTHLDAAGYAALARRVLEMMR